MVKIDNKWCCFHLRWCHLGDEIGVVLILRFQPKILRKIQKICGDKIFRNSAFFWMYEGSYKIDSRLFITHFFWFQGASRNSEHTFCTFLRKKTSEKYFTKKNFEKCCRSVFLECIHQNVFFKCICRDIELYFEGKKVWGLGSTRKGSS